MNNQQSQNAAGANIAATKGLSKFDLVITSTMATALTIEMFNHDFSQTKVYNASVQQAPQQNFHPLGATFSPLIVKTGTTNGYALAFTVGGYDTFVNGANAVPPAGFNSNAYCGFDENGQLVYQPGYVNGALDGGVVTLQSRQTNYRHIFEVMGKAAMVVNYARIKVGVNFVDQLNEQFSYVQSNIVAAASSVPFSPDTYETENQNQSNIVTLPVNKEINPKTGLTYTVQPSSGGNPNIVNMSLFFTPLSANLLNLI